jgi:hypothetical protein
MSEELLRRLALHELSDQQDRLGMHDRLDGSRLLNPHLPGVLMRGGLHELHLEAQQAGNSYKVRPSVPGSTGTFTNLALDNDSVPLWKNASDHTQAWRGAPSYFQWGLTLYPNLGNVGFRGPWSWDTKTPFATVTVTMPATAITTTIQLLDASSNVLKWAQAAYTCSYSYSWAGGIVPVITEVASFGSLVWTYDTNGPIAAFNAVMQATTPLSTYYTIPDWPYSNWTIGAYLSPYLGILTAALKEVGTLAGV